MLGNAYKNIDLLCKANLRETRVLALMSGLVAKGGLRKHVPPTAAVGICRVTSSSLKELYRPVTRMTSALKETQRTQQTRRADALRAQMCIDLRKGKLALG